MSILKEKFRNNLQAVVPITIIVLILNFTIAPLGMPLVIRFLIGSALIIIGLSFFLIGVDIGITPFGSLLGTALSQSKKLWIVVIAGFVLGFVTSIAEPGLMVLANQVDLVTSGNISSLSILLVVSIGLAIMLSLGFIRIFFNFPLYKMLIILYLIILVLALFTSREFLAISFDASGATTGILAVPFILSLSVGISALKKDSKSSEKDSFGLVAIASVGAIIAVMILNLVTHTSEFSTGLGGGIQETDSIFLPFLSIVPTYTKESILAILPLLVIFLVMQKVSFKLGKKALRKLLFGFAYALIGMIIFMVGVNGSFMEVGTVLGTKLLVADNKIFIVIVGFVLGLVTILAEPAVYVLTHQIEEVTSGYVKRKAVLVSLSIGVGIAIALSAVRILVPAIQLWHYLLPGYIICILMTFFAPKLFVGIAFDAGGVATGPMTATFILAFTQGVADAFEGADLLVEGFGMIAMVAMMPIITLQILGIIFKIKSKTKGDELKHE